MNLELELGANMASQNFRNSLENRNSSVTSSTWTAKSCSRCESDRIRTSEAGSPRSKPTRVILQKPKHKPRPLSIVRSPTKFKAFRRSLGDNTKGISMHINIHGRLQQLQHLPINDNANWIFATQLPPTNPRKRSEDAVFVQKIRSRLIFALDRPHGRLLRDAKPSKEALSRSSILSASDGAASHHKAQVLHGRLSDVHVELESISVANIMQLAKAGDIVDIIPSVMMIQIPMTRATQRRAERYIDQSERDKASRVPTKPVDVGRSIYSQRPCISRLSISGIDKAGRRRSNNTAGLGGVEDERWSVTLVALTDTVADVLRCGLERLRL